MSDIPQSCKIQTPNAIGDGQENYDMTSVNIYIAPSEYIHHGGDKILLLCKSSWKVAEKVVTDKKDEDEDGPSNSKGLVLKGLACQ